MVLTESEQFISIMFSFQVSLHFTHLSPIKTQMEEVEDLFYNPKVIDVKEGRNICFLFGELRITLWRMWHLS